MADGTITNGNGSRTITDKLISWLLGQEANTVMLILLFFSLLYGGYYAVTIGVPKHIQQIQDGYDRCAASHEKTIQKITDSQDKERERLWRAIEREKAVGSCP